ncbi:MAG: preprotein translocase subunit SecE [Dermatophilaceae bacterium]
MSETSAPRRTARPRDEGGNVLGRAVRRLSRYVRQILDELSKVVRPTGSELVNYTAVVIVFVLAIMGIVAGLDFVLHQLVLLVFAGG